MADIISLTADRVQRVKQRPRCHTCGNRLVFVEQATPLPGKVWDVYRCSGCKGIQWKQAGEGRLCDDD